MTIRGKAFIAGAFEHPGRVLPDLSVPQIHAEVAAGALADAGLEFDDVDAYFCAGDAPGFGPLSMAEYLGLRCSLRGQHRDGRLLVRVPRRPRGGGDRGRQVPGGADHPGRQAPDAATRRRSPDGAGCAGVQLRVSRGACPARSNGYALAAQRHMYEFGTTSEQLAEIKVAASQHAQYNPNAFLRSPVTVEEVLASPMVSAPLHRLDCCVVTDGGGAVVVVTPRWPGTCRAGRSRSSATARRPSTPTTAGST